MNCPTDGTVLAITDRQGIEIDYCPTCRGVWLDRGELDKLIERSNRDDDQRYKDRDQDRDRDRDDKPYRDHDRDEHFDPRYAKPKKKKKSFFSEVFEFGE